MRQLLKHKSSILAAAFLSLLLPLFVSTTVFALDTCGAKFEDNKPVKMSIDIGCQGKGNPIADMTFAIIRFLTGGVGLVMVGSLVVAGIQYAGARGDPQSAAHAIQRIQSTMIALILFIFGYAILNFVIPAGFLK